MDGWQYTDLQGRIMIHFPWRIYSSKYQNPSHSFPQPGFTIRKIVNAFSDAGGNKTELVQLLNKHVPDPLFQTTYEELCEDSRWYSLEYYFYVFQFSKYLLNDPLFRYGGNESFQLDRYHMILERGPLKTIPWRVKEDGYFDDYLSITNMTAMFKYVEMFVPNLPFSNETAVTIGESLSREALTLLNCCALPEYKVDRAFFNNSEILVSCEYLFYITGIFEILTNNESFAHDALYYGFKHNNSIGRAVFLQTIKSPIDGYRKWQLYTNNLYNMEFHQKGRRLFVHYNLRRLLQQNVFGINKNYCIQGIEQACIGTSKAFIELATNKPAKVEIKHYSENSDSFTIKMKLPSVIDTKKILFISVFISTIAVSLLSIGLQSISKYWISIILLFPINFIIIGLAALSLYWRKRFFLAEERFSDAQEIINDQLTSLSQRADELLKERNNLEEKVKQRTNELRLALDELKELDHAKISFLASISHELRTPLTLLCLPFEEICSGRLGKNIPNNHSIFSLINRNINRIKSKISSLLEFTQLDLGKADFNPLPLNILEYCSLLSEELSSLAEKKGLSLRFINESNKSEINIEADKLLLESVLLNMLFNAIKFTQEGGVQIILRTAPNSHVQLIIKDTGIGISEENHEKIFNKFIQVRSYEDRYIEGSGLGLALVKEIIDIHHWQIELESAPGMGSSFILTIPELTVETESPAVTISDSIKQQAIAELEIVPTPVQRNIDDIKDNILIIEDNPDMGTILQKLLSPDYNVYWCSSGESALEYLSGNREVSLFLCDVMMPGMSGYTFRKKMIRINEYSSSPFIFLTALRTAMDKLDGLKGGAVDYISKPFSREELLLKIRNLINSHKATYMQAVRDKEGNKRLIKNNTYSTIQVNLDQYSITPAEKRILEFLHEGLQDKEIAERLSLSKRTVSTHLSHLYTKTDTNNRVELLNIIYS